MSWRNREGTQWTCVTRDASSQASRRRLSVRVASSGMHRVPPANSGKKISRRLTSKVGGASWLTLVSPPAPNSPTSQWMKWLSPFWLPRIAFGAPVEPEVKTI